MNAAEKGPYSATSKHRLAQLLFTRYVRSPSISRTQPLDVEITATRFGQLTFTLQYMETFTVLMHQSKPYMNKMIAEEF